MESEWFSKKTNSLSLSLSSGLFHRLKTTALSFANFHLFWIPTPLERNISQTYFDIFPKYLNSCFIFLNLFKVNPLNIFIFLKSRIGHLILYIIRLFTKNNFSFKNLFYAIHAIVYPFLHITSIVNGDLEIYEKDFPI